VTVVLQVSDPHFGTERPDVVEALVRLARTLDPDVLLMSGDITQRAKPSEFAAAKAFVDRVGARQVVVIPGNHDIPLFNLFARAVSPYGHYQEVFPGTLEPVLSSPDLLLIGVNSTRNYRHKDGTVSAEQIARVSAALMKRRPGQLGIVVAHHPVHVLSPQESKNLLHGHRAALGTWVLAGADLVLGGHIHLPFVRPVNDALPGLGRDAWVVQAGTAVSTRTRANAPNSVNVIRYSPSVDAGRCAIERWDCADPAEGFTRVDQILVTPSRGSRSS
jgi:3',5'-cyclic AMP phosphodiesterase CpdA